jgi:hypothetical protein
MYHELTEFPANGGMALRFTQVLEMAAKVFDKANHLFARDDKFRRIDVTAVVMFLQDLTKDPYFKLDNKSVDELATRIVASKELNKPTGKTTSASSLKEYYGWWRDNVAGTVGIRLDPPRNFDDQQKKQIRKKANSICAMCGEYVFEADEEFDHFPIPYRDGGRTEAQNGRLVHRTCHERGRPIQSD